VPLVFSQIVWLNIPMLLVKLFVVLSVLTFASLSGLSQDRSVLDLATLSGHWEGLMSVAQTGACRLTGPQQFPHAVVLMVNADGSFTGAALFMTGKKAGQPDPDFAWRGQVQTDLTVLARITIKGMCHDESRKAEDSFRGRVLIKDGKYELQVEGVSTVCANIKCTFRHTFDLTQK
jgi:hypothetical protein